MAIWFRFLAPGIISFLLAGCGGPGESALVWVGHPSPLTGPEAAVGESARRGIDLAVEEANQDPAAKGAGRPVRVLHTDTHSDPAAFGAEVTRLVRLERVAAVVGGRDPAEITEFTRLPTEIPLVSPGGLWNEGLAGGGIFFTGLSPARRGEALARFAAEKGFGPVLVLVNDDPERPQFRALAEAFAGNYPGLFAQKHAKRTADLIGPLRYGKDTPLGKRARRVRAAMTRADSGKRAKPDAVLLAGPPADVKTFREELGSAGAGLPVLFGGGEGALPDLLEESETARGVYVATAYVPEAATDRNKAFAKRFRERFHRPPDVHAALAYDDARMLFQALREAQSTAPGPVREHLAGLKDFPGLTGPISFGPFHEARREVLVVRTEGGRATLVKSYAAEASKDRPAKAGKANR